MNKLLLKSLLIFIAFIGLVTTQTTAQTSWEFKDAATGTAVWGETSNLTSVQKSNSVVYTTTAGDNPYIKTTSANIQTNGTQGNIDATPSSRRLFAITMRVSAGGPTLLRVVYPGILSSNYYRNIALTADGNFRTYYVDLTRSNVNENRYKDWYGTKDVFTLRFKVEDAVVDGGAPYNNAGATIEIDRIEFVNNVYKGTVGSTGNTGNNGNWVFKTPSEDGAEDVLFPSGTLQSPTISTTLHVNSISLGAGVNLANVEPKDITVDNDIVFGIGSSFVPDASSIVNIGGSVVHKLEVTNSNWHLISSAVDAEQYNDTWITANGIASGGGNNRGISTYDNVTVDPTTGFWRYFQAVGVAKTFDDGVGYAVKATDATGDIYEFTGAYQAETIRSAITQGVNNYNLVGNPYSAYLDVSAFILENTSKFSAAAKAIYVLDAANKAYTSLNTGYIQPGQAFFINSGEAIDGVDFTPAMQGHDASAPFYKSSETSIKLAVTDGKSTKRTAINYLDGKTTGLDAGFDIGLFTGVASRFLIYTHLLENNEGIAFERQALPTSDLEAMAIPIGVNAKADKEITFTAETLNLPAGLKVFLEDRVNNTFTRLDEANASYKVTLTAALDGVGRFYLHTRAGALSVDNVTLTGVSIFKTNASTLRVTGLQQGKASLSLFNVLGKQVMSTSFEATGTKDISLPKLATGVYFAKVQTATGKLSKKIILE